MFLQVSRDMAPRDVKVNRGLRRSESARDAMMSQCCCDGNQLKFRSQSLGRQQTNLSNNETILSQPKVEMYILISLVVYFIIMHGLAA